MPTLFISDLHLAPERPQITELFLGFTRTTARGADALYILGDLFEYWVGDDDLEDPLNGTVSSALSALAASDTAVHLMRGNRDVLLGSSFASRCHATLLDDPVLVNLYGTPTLLSHGDALCTDDVEYQRFRLYARDTGNQQKFLSQSLDARREQMRGMRAQSEASKQQKTGAIMDVAPAAVEALLRQHGYPRLIHGHTHRPAHHLHSVDGQACERWVLNDWYDTGGYLRCDAAGCTAVLS